MPQILASLVSSVSSLFVEVVVNSHHRLECTLAEWPTCDISVAKVAEGKDTRKSSHSQQTSVPSHSSLLNTVKRDKVQENQSFLAASLHGS